MSSQTALIEHLSGRIRGELETATRSPADRTTHRVGWWPGIGQRNRRAELQAPAVAASEAAGAGRRLRLPSGCGLRTCHPRGWSSCGGPGPAAVGQPCSPTASPDYTPGSGEEHGVMRTGAADPSSKQQPNQRCGCCAARLQAVWPPRRILGELRPEGSPGTTAKRRRGSHPLPSAIVDTHDHAGRTAPIGTSRAGGIGAEPESRTAIAGIRKGGSQ